MNEKLTAALKSITDSRTQKYNEEIERQKGVIEEELFAFLESRKKVMDNLERANRNHQTEQSHYFMFMLEVGVLPEVAEYIESEYSIKVDKHDNRKVYAYYAA